MSECEVCGARQGMWHNEKCIYRLGAPFDEFLCQHIGEKDHNTIFESYKELIRKY
jgi:hypothetical protein